MNRKNSLKLILAIQSIVAFYGLYMTGDAKTILDCLTALILLIQLPLIQFIILDMEGLI